MGDERRKQRGSAGFQSHPRDPSHRRGWAEGWRRGVWFGNVTWEPGGIQAELSPAELDIYSGLRLQEKMS